jgi:S-adenosylmethionine synthetase
MFGYACNETPELMPAPISLAHGLVRRLSQVRREGKLPYLRPDGKSQVSVRYVDGKPVRVETVVVSAQHAPDVPHEQLREEIIEHVVWPVLPAQMVDRRQITMHINPTGRFVTGGPMGDTGVTGRKIIVDTYGGSCPHGGGAFSGKDPTKVDRSRPTWRGTSPRTSSRPGSPSGAWCRWRTPSASWIRCRSWSRRSGPASSPRAGSSS